MEIKCNALVLRAVDYKENDKLLMISDNDEALLQAYDALGVKEYTMKKN